MVANGFGTRYMFCVMIPPVADNAACGWKNWQFVAQTSSTSRRISVVYCCTSVCGSAPRMSVWTNGKCAISKKFSTNAQPRGFDRNSTADDDAPVGLVRFADRQQIGR